MDLRSKRQEEFADVWMNSERFSILNLCPRFGKIRTTINILRKLKPKKILIAYPQVNIKKSWENEFALCNYKPEGITYTTHRSLFKHTASKFDLVIIDEIHLLSEAQVVATSMMISSQKPNVLGLTGTLSKFTKAYLRRALGLKVIVEYPLEIAIREGIITDYRITVIKVPLDNTKVLPSSKKRRTEKGQLDAYSYVINKLEEEGKDTKFLRLARVKIFQRSLSKLRKTKEILEKIS